VGDVQCDAGETTVFGILKKMARKSMKRNVMLQVYGKERRDSLWRREQARLAM